MNPDERTEEIEEFETALDTIPEEVRKFLWSDNYQGLLSVLVKKFGLSDAQKKVVDNIIFDTIAGILDDEEEETEKRLTEAGITDEKQGELIAYIYKYFIDPSAKEAEQAAELEEDTSITTPETTAPSPTDVIKSIQGQFSAPTPIAPAAREQQPEKQPETGIKKIDPYREMPE